MSVSGPGMRQTVWCTWILCVILLISFADTKPDPPALDTHCAALNARSASECVTTACEPVVGGLSGVLAVFPGHNAILVPEHIPDSPASVIALMGQAADSSPPFPRKTSNPEA